MPVMSIRCLPKLLLITYLLLLWLRAVPCTIENRIMKSSGLHAMNSFHVDNDGTIMVLKDLDMMLTLDQAEKINFHNSTYIKRNIVKNMHSRWPNGFIPYEIADDVKNEEENIEEAIGEYTKYSCIRFEENNKATPRVLVRKDTNCWANVGFKDKKITTINLVGDCFQVSVIVHEIGHVVGLYHEQSRPDRDRYVKVHKDYLGVNNWIKQSFCDVTTKGIEYDYRSIMHYSRGITALDSAFDAVIDNVQGLSFRDIKLINIIYECAEKASCDVFSECPFNGFMMPHPLQGEAACTCWCDSGDAFNFDPLIPCSSLDKSLEPVYELRARSTIDTDSEACYDFLENCEELKEKGYCFTEKTRMKRSCQKTCGFCGKDKDFCADSDDACVILAESGMCKDKKLEALMNNECPKSCGKCVRYKSDCDIEGIIEENHDFLRSVNCSSYTRPWISVILVVLLGFGMWY